MSLPHQLVNKLRALPLFNLIVLTQDFHPANHCSFFENNKSNPNAKPFEVLDLPEVGPQVIFLY